MLDHLIVGQSFEGRQGYFSFKEAGYDMMKTTNARSRICLPRGGWAMCSRLAAFRKFSSSATATK
jgi:hypothetical protein